jgi:hypothetical protein
MISLNAARRWVTGWPGCVSAGSLQAVIKSGNERMRKMALRGMAILRSLEWVSEDYEPSGDFQFPQSGERLKFG